MSVRGLQQPGRTREWGVRFLEDGSVAHRWNGHTQRQRAYEEVERLRAEYPRDRFEVVVRVPDGPWTQEKAEASDD